MNKLKIIITCLLLVGCKPTSKPEISFGNIMYCQGTVSTGFTKYDINLSSGDYLTLDTNDDTIILRSPDFKEILTIERRTNGKQYFDGNIKYFYNDGSLKYNSPLNCIIHA